MPDQSLPVEEAADIDTADHAPATGDDLVPSRYRHPWRWMVLVVFVVAAAAIVAVLLFRDDAGNTAADEADTLNTAEVVTANLEQEATFAAVLGTIAEDPVATAIAGTLRHVPEPGATIAHGDVLFTVGVQPVVLLYGDEPAFRDFTAGEDTATVSSHLSGTITWVPEPGTVIEQGDVLFRVDDEPVVALYGDLPTYRQLSDTSPNTTGTDVLQLETALVALGYDANGTVTVDDEFTFRTRQMVRRWQDDLGVEDDGVVQFGDVVFLPGPAQVVEQVVAPGDGAGGPILVVATGEPLTGSDVRQLEAALAGLDFDADGTLVVDGTYSPETTQAVFAFQAATGLPADGILSSGEIVLLPGEAQVTEQFAAEGSTVDPGSVILGVSLSEKVVQMELPADQQGLLAVSDAVIVELPDGTEVPATVSFVSQTATPSDFGEAFFEIQIGLDDPAVAGDLDEAPVDVIVVADSVENVLAVPVSALVALLEGGYAVELDTGGGIVELVGVEVGFFGSNNMVEITSASLQPGDRVVVP